MAVVWRDILEDVNGWLDAKVKLEPVYVTTVGILFMDYPDYLLIVRDMYYNPEINEWVLGGRMAIPKGVIVSQVKLGEMANEEHS